MIKLVEQYGFKKPRLLPNIESFVDRLGNQNYSKTVKRAKEKSLCFNILYSSKEEKPEYLFETSYFVGVDWVVEGELPIYVMPKLNNELGQVDYLKMLFDSLQEEANFQHLDDLYFIDFDKPAILIEQKEDLLTPLLLIEYLNLLKKIVRKGLKKSYYPITKNLNAKVKGKILVNETIKKNHFKNKLLFNYCDYSEFGINTAENKLLKKALSFSIAAVQNLKGVNTAVLSPVINYINPAFQQVDDEDNINILKKFRTDSFYQEYEQALNIAKIILKKYGYNISSVNANEVKTPPFWIDMSKLFELYVFSKLKEKFPVGDEVVYHKKVNYLEPDYIVKSKDEQFKIVVDAKYKPRYKDKNVVIDDIRQISGYARLTGIYKVLDIADDKLIDCLVVYSHQDSERDNFKDKNFSFESFVAEENYKRFFKIGIRLPEISKD